MHDCLCLCDAFGGPIIREVQPGITGTMLSSEPCPPEHMNFCWDWQVPAVYDTGRASGVWAGTDAFVDFDWIPVLLHGRTHLGARRDLGAKRATYTAPGFCRQVRVRRDSLFGVKTCASHAISVIAVLGYIRRTECSAIRYRPFSPERIIWHSCVDIQRTSSLCVQAK